MKNKGIEIRAVKRVKRVFLSISNGSCSRRQVLLSKKQGRGKWWINRTSPTLFFINERAKGVDRVGGGRVVWEAAV